MEAQEIVIQQGSTTFTFRISMLMRTNYVRRGLDLILNSGALLNGKTDLYSPTISSTFLIEYHLLWQRRQEARNSEKVGWYFESLILSFNACQKTGTNQGISLLFPMQYFAAHRCLFNAAATSILMVPILFCTHPRKARGKQNGEHQYVDVSIRVNTHLLNM